MKWAGYSCIIQQSCIHREEVAKNLVALLDIHKVEILIMKDLALQKYYDNSEDRLFDDLDIYTIGKHDFVRELIQSDGINIEYGDKHDLFTFDSVAIELHKQFFDEEFRSGRVLNEYLEKISNFGKLEKDVD